MNLKDLSSEGKIAYLIVPILKVLQAAGGQLDRSEIKERIADLDDQIASYKTFIENWGGESIYNFYDNPHSCHDQSHLRYIKNKLHDISTPCIIILRCPPSVYDALSRCSFYNNFMTKSIKTLFDSLNLKTCVPEVIDVVKLTEYSGLDYS